MSDRQFRTIIAVAVAYLAGQVFGWGLVITYFWWLGSR